MGKGGGGGWVLSAQSSNFCPSARPVFHSSISLGVIFFLLPFVDVHGPPGEMPARPIEVSVPARLSGTFAVVQAVGERKATG